MQREIKLCKECNTMKNIEGDTCARCKPIPPLDENTNNMQGENKTKTLEYKFSPEEAKEFEKEVGLQRENKWQDEFIRDVTQVGSIPKSEVRRRINEIVDRAVAEERGHLWNDANGIVALFGALLMSKGIVGEEKEIIKKCLASVIKNVLNK